MVVGTGTVAIDNPELSARPTGIDNPHQPLRIVLGERETDGSKVWRDDNAVRVASRDPRAALAAAWERECRVVLIEGGAAVISAFLREGLVDEVHAYIAPAILGNGPSAASDVGIGTMANALRGRDVTVLRLGADTLVTAQFTEAS